jgi:hypothetical protein
MFSLSKGPNRVGISLPSPKDRNRSSFRNGVFSSIWNSRRWLEPRNPVILSTARMHYRLSNPSKGDNMTLSYFLIQDVNVIHCPVAYVLKNVPGWLSVLEQGTY